MPVTCASNPATTEPVPKIIYPTSGEDRIFEEFSGGLAGACVQAVFDLLTPLRFQAEERGP
jgi:hypothetical protein